MMKERDRNKLAKMNNNRRCTREEQWTSTGCVELSLGAGCVCGGVFSCKFTIHVENTVYEISHYWSRKKGYKERKNFT